MADTLYEQDFVVWTETQAEALRAAARAGSNQPLDYENLAEEIGDLGSEIRHKVESLARQIMIHLLKLACSSTPTPRGVWMSEVAAWRVQLSRRLARNPSLRTDFDGIVQAELPTAVDIVEREFRYHHEPPATDALGAWRARGISADEGRTQGLLPEPGTTRFRRDAD